jgi:hypothetical protein
VCYNFFPIGAAQMDELKNCLLIESNQTVQQVKREGWISTLQTSSTQHLSLAAGLLSAGAGWGAGFGSARWLIRLRGRGSQLLSGAALALLAYLATSRVAIPKVTTEVLDYEPIYRAALEEVVLPASDDEINSDIRWATIHAREWRPSLDQETRELWVEGINLVKRRWLQWRDSPMEQLDGQTIAISAEHAKLVYKILCDQFRGFKHTCLGGAQDPPTGIAEALQQILAVEELFDHRRGNGVQMVKKHIELHIQDRLRELKEMLQDNSQPLTDALQADSWQQLKERWPKKTASSQA